MESRHCLTGADPSGAGPPAALRGCGSEGLTVGALAAAYEELGCSPGDALLAARARLAPRFSTRRSHPARWAGGALCVNLGLAVAIAQGTALAWQALGAGAALAVGQLIVGAVLGRALAPGDLRRALLTHHAGYLAALVAGGLAAAALFPVSWALLPAAITLAGSGIAFTTTAAGRAARGRRGRPRSAFHA